MCLYSLFNIHSERLFSENTSNSPTWNCCLYVFISSTDKVFQMEGSEKRIFFFLLFMVNHFFRAGIFFYKRCHSKDSLLHCILTNINSASLHVTKEFRQWWNTEWLTLSNMDSSSVPDESCQGSFKWTISKVSSQEHTFQLYYLIHF